MAGDTLIVTGTWDAEWFDRCDVGFRITVPAGFDVTVQTDNGHVTIGVRLRIPLRDAARRRPQRNDCVCRSLIVGLSTADQAFSLVSAWSG